MNLSNTGRSKYILLPKRGNEISERLWFSLSSQAAAGKETLLSCHWDSYATCHSQHAGSEAAQSSINLLRWAANIQSKDLKMSNSTKDESPRNAGSTQFKVRWVGTDYEALDSWSCLMRLGVWDPLRGSRNPWAVTISARLETSHSGVCPNFSLCLTQPAASGTLPGNGRPEGSEVRLGLLQSTHLGFFPTTTSFYWCPFWKSAISPLSQ